MNLTPSLIISSSTSFPSWPIIITFLRSTINVKHPEETRASSHSLLSTPTPDETSSPSTTMRHCRLVLTVVIFSMAILLGQVRSGFRNSTNPVQEFSVPRDEFSLRRHGN